MGEMMEGMKQYYDMTKELISLTEEMQCAMMRANTEYVRHGKLTGAMKDILKRFFMWAEEDFSVRIKEARRKK